jgi:hypothetical protein
MNVKAKIVSLFIFATLTASVLLLKGCGGTGSSNQPSYTGCPSGSVVANSTDKMTSNPDADWGSGILLFPGAPTGFVPTGPVTFTVTDASGAPSNNVCISFTTDGFWWTDNTNTTQQVGTGVINRITKATDANGTIMLNWTSHPVLYSAPAISAAGAVTAGADVNGKSQIYALSGAVADTFNAKWTVTGCAAASYGIVSPAEGHCP